MFFPPKIRLAAAPAAGLALLALAAPVAATTSEDMTAIAVRHANLEPQTPEEAHRLLTRLDAAATEACGASSFSLREYQQAVRGSACWRTSMSDVVQRIDNPRLTAAYLRQRPEVIVSPGGDSAGGR